MVWPPAFMAAIPVGANTTHFFPVPATKLRSKVDFPVPAFPVTRIAASVSCITSVMCCKALFSVFEDNSYFQNIKYKQEGEIIAVLPHKIILVD